MSNSRATLAPRYFVDCSSVEEKLQWAASPQGQAVLASRPKLLELYRNGKLRYMLSSPEWTDRLNKWLDDRPALSRLGSFFSSPRQEPSTGSPSVLRTPPPRPLPTERLYALMIHGYTVLPAFVSQELCFNAIKYINYRIGSPAESLIKQTKTADLASTILNDAELMNLYYLSGLAGAVTLLLHGCCPAQSAKSSFFGTSGSGGPQYDVLRADVCQVALRFPQMDRPFPAGAEGPPLGGVQWHTDGMDRGDYAPFTLLVGIALSDQSLPYSGNLCVFPGSHYSLQGFVRGVAAAGAAFDEIAETPGPSAAGASISKPVLDEPTQVLLRTGDVVLLHQKLAHRGGPNFNCDVRRMVYFRISHMQHKELKNASIENLWLEFEGMNEIL